MFDRIVAIEPVGLYRDATGCLQVLGKQMVMYDDRPDGEEERGRTVGAFYNVLYTKRTSVIPSSRFARLSEKVIANLETFGMKENYPAGRKSFLPGNFLYYICNISSRLNWLGQTAVDLFDVIEQVAAPFLFLGRGVKERRQLFPCLQ